MGEKLRHAETWTAWHRGIKFRIQHHAVSEYNPGGIWCYYVYVPLAQVRPVAAQADFALEPRPVTRVGSKRKRQKARRYYLTEAAPDLDWHCGCTFYRLHRHPEGEVAEMGCDYGHAWDEEYTYDERMLARDARQSIDVLRDKYPKLLQRCNYNGGYYTAKEGEDTEQGWRSYEGRDQEAEWARKNEERKAKEKP